MGKLVYALALHVRDTQLYNLSLSLSRFFSYYYLTPCRPKVHGELEKKKKQQSATILILKELIIQTCNLSICSGLIYAIFRKKDESCELHKSRRRIAGDRSVYTCASYLLRAQLTSPFSRTFTPELDVLLMHLGNVL